MKVALVCDWLTNVGGAEKVLLELHKLYPKAPIYTSKYSRKGIDWFDDADVRTGWLQIFPTCLRRILGPLRQRWFEKLDLSEYDLIISVTGAEAKAVKSGKWRCEHGEPTKNPRGIHVSYCHVPTQYYWQMHDEYVRDPGVGLLNPLVRFCFKILVRPLRKADYRAAQVPEQIVTISEYARELIDKYYHRKAVVIHPPVEIEEFGGSLQTPHEYYIITSRQVNWKRIDLAVKACMKLRRELYVVGEGPEHNNLVKLSNESELIKFVPLVGKEELAELLAGAKGYIFPSKEPFGIAPVEALAAGCPVIAYGEGGALDYVTKENGVLFKKQSIKDLTDAILEFEGHKFDRDKVVKSAKKFDVRRFDKEIRELIDEKVG